MKKSFWIIAIICAIICAFGYNHAFAAGATRKNIKGSGTVITKFVDAPDFHKISASRAVHVVISNEPTGKIRIEADDNLMDYVYVKADGGVLRITMDDELHNITQMNVTVTVPVNKRLSDLRASSAAHIVCKTAFRTEECEIAASSAARIAVAVKCDKCELSASSAARITAAIEANSCSIELSSAARAEVTGSAKECEADLSSAARLAAGGFVVADYSVDASSSAGARVNCTQSLEASASSGASVTYSGDCRQVHIQKSSGGSVRKD